MGNHMGFRITMGFPMRNSPGNSNGTPNGNLHRISDGESHDMAWDATAQTEHERPGKNNEDCPGL